MTLGALIDAGVSLAAIQAGVASLGLTGVTLETAEVKRRGFRGTQLTVRHQPEHAHRHLHHIVAMIDGSALTARQKELAKRIFTRLGEAEAKVHGTTIQKVHFHEVGAVDSIADICGAAIAFDLLGVDRIMASPVPTGRGEIEIAHGRCSIPAPATAELLTGIPLAASNVAAELTTPTGAAILATLVDEFGPLPSFTISKIGYGAGSRDMPEQPNLLRLLVGESAEPVGADQVWVVETNLDDVAGEVIGHCTAKLWEAGALDVYTTAVQMKKNRPGVVLSVLCTEAGLSGIEKIIFRETGTLGLRRWSVSRHKMERRAHMVETAFGPIAGKLGWFAGEAPCFSPEFDACQQVANQRGVPLRDVYEAAHQAWRETGKGSTE
jgi:uncharacterized protein (TIGR00299 family) protein